MNSEMVILMPVYNPNERIVNYVKKLKENNYQVVLINDGFQKVNIILFLKRWCMIARLSVILFLKEKGMLLKKEFIISKNIYRIKKELLF